MQTIKTTMKQIKDSMKNYQLWEPNIRAALAAAMRDAGARNIVQTKSAFAAGNGEESRRAKGRFVGTFAELLADATIVRACVDSADIKVVGARKYAVMVEAAEWLEGCVNSYTDSYIRNNSVEVVEEDAAAQESAPAPQVTPQVAPQVAQVAQVAAPITDEPAAPASVEVEDDECDEPLRDEGDAYDVGYGENYFFGGVFVNKYAQRIKYAPKATLCAEYGTFLVDNEKMIISRESWSTAEDCVTQRAEYTEFAEMAVKGSVTTFKGWAAYADFAQGVGRQCYAVGATPAGAVRAADEALKQAAYYEEEDAASADFCPDEEEHGWLSGDDEEPVSAATLTRAVVGDDWSDLLEMDTASDLAPSRSFGAGYQIVPVWTAPLSCVTDSEDEGQDYSDHNSEPADGDEGRSWGNSDEYSDEQPYGDLMSENEKAAFSAAMDCDPWMASQRGQGFEAGVRAHAKWMEAWRNLSARERETVWALLPAVVKLLLERSVWVLMSTMERIKLSPERNR